MMGQSSCTSVTYSGVHPRPLAATMSVDCTPCCIRLASSFVVAVVLRGYVWRSLGTVLSTKVPYQKPNCRMTLIGWYSTPVVNPSSTTNCMSHVLKKTVNGSAVEEMIR